MEREPGYTAGFSSSYREYPRSIKAANGLSLIANFKIQRLVSTRLRFYVSDLDHQPVDRPVQGRP